MVFLSTRLLKKSLSLFLSAMLALSGLSALALCDLSVTASAASGYSPTGDFYKISETEHKIAPGITENRVIVNKTSGMQQEVVYAVSVDANAPSAGFMVGYADYSGSRWKMQKVRDQAAAAQNATGANIVAAFNADIFNMQTGEPTGCLIMGGNIYKEGLGRPYFGVTKDGRYVMGEKLTQKVLNTLREGVSGFYMIVKNGMRYGPGNDPESNIAPKTCVGFKADGTVLVVCVDGRNYPISSNLSDYDLATIMMDLGCVDVLNLDGGGSTTYLAKYEGKSALELANNPSDAVERAVASSLFIVSTARPSGVFDHASLTPNNTLYTPNSTVTFSAIGVDSAGESAPLPADGAFALASDSAGKGAITPEGVFTANDSTGVVNVNYVSGGAVVGSTFIEIATPDELYIPSEEYSLDFDESTDFDIVAKNAGRTIEIKDGDLVWSKSPEFSMNQKFVYNDADVMYTDGCFAYPGRDESFDGGATNTESFSTGVARSVKEVLSESFTGDGETTSFTLTNRAYSLKAVYVNGSKLASSNYTYTRSTGVLAFNAAPAADAAIEIQYNLYAYNFTLAAPQAAADLISVTCSSAVTDYTYDETTGAGYFESIWSATTKVKYYVHNYTLDDPSDAILVYLDGTVIDTGFTYDSATGVLAFNEAHPGSTILVKKVLSPAQSQALTESLMGSFSGNTFTTASSNSCTGTVTAKSAYDDSVAVSTRAVIGAAPVMLYDFEYTDDADEAAASGGRLTWIPSMDLPIFDKNNDLGLNPELKTHTALAADWYAEGYPLYGWPNASLGPTAMRARIVSEEDGEPVRFGDHSLRMDVDFSTFNGTSNSNNYVRVTSPAYFFEGAPKKMSAWVYVPEGMANFALYLNCCNKDESITYAPVSIMDGNHATNWTGWRYVEIDLSTPGTGTSNISPTSYPYGFYQGCGVFWVSYQPGPGNGTLSASTIYIDNIQLIYSSNTDDTKNPEVTAITYDTDGAPAEFVNNETVLTDNTVTIRASYKDAEDKYMTGINPEAVYMSVDGVDVTDRCFINAGDEQMYLYDAQLNDGVHSVSVTVYDNFGNKTTDTRYFTVEGSSAATAELTAEQEHPVLGSAYVLDVKTADASDVAGADIAVHTFAAFTYFYDDVTVIPAEGYALDGEAVYDSTNAIVSFRLVKDGAAVPADGVIARISYNIPSNVRADSIDVRFRVDKGGITYVSDKGEKYLGSFGGSVETSCIAPLEISSDTFLVGQGGYFYVTDLDGAPVSGASVVYQNGDPVCDGVTDEQGRLYTEAFRDAVIKFTVRAEKDGGDTISFYYTEQSYASGGSADGMPTSIALNGALDGSSMINVSWFSSPAASADRAVARYAVKAVYEAEGDAALREIEGITRLEELNSSTSIETNYALRFNKVVIGGLAPETEYVYFVGDGDKMSEMRTFKTDKKNVDTNFFVIGDMQDDDTANLNAILDALENSDVNYAFGLQTGDAVDNGGMYKWWVNVASVFSSGYLSTRPIVHVLGNHEYYGDYSGANSADYFGMTLADGSAPHAYSTAYGNVYMAVINYSDDASVYEEAIEWVRADAAASSAAWKVLTLHQPAYYTNPGGGSKVVNQLIPPLVDEVGFDFVFSGHDHSYVRTYAVTGGERDDDGAVYYICGSTGEKSYQVVENETFPYAFVRGSAATEGEYNAIYLTASTTDTSFTVDTHDVTVNPDGTYTDEIIDSYTKTKTITCSESGEHVFGYGDGELVCTVCGYTKPLGNYTGFAEDIATGGTRYFVYGETKTGWLNHGTDCYYFDEDGLAVPAGTQTIDGVEYTFDDEGRQIGGSFVTIEDGYVRCYRGGDYLTGWNEIDGKTYFFSTNATHPGKMLTGEATITIYTGQKITYKFASDGHLLDYVWVEEDEGTRYYWGQNPVTGWMTINGKQYYFDPVTALMQTGEVEIDGQIYSFDKYGVFKHEGAHDYVYKSHTEASCTIAEGDIYACSICGEQKKEITGPALGHVDNDNDDLCDVCGKYYKAKVSFLEPLLRFFARIRNWFLSLFRRRN